MLAVAALGLVAVAAALSAGLCLVVIRVAPAVGLLDRPGGHKGHRVPTPLGGGLAIWLTTVSLPLLGLVVMRAGRGWLPGPLARHAGGVAANGGALLLIL